MRLFDEFIKTIDILVSTGKDGVYAMHQLNGLKMKKNKQLVSLYLRAFPMLMADSIVTTGKLLSGEDLDPEDKVGAESLLQCIAMVKQIKNKTTIRYSESIDNISGIGNIFAIGGPLSNPLNRVLGHTAPFHKSNQPDFPLYLHLDYNSKYKVKRMFNGNVHERPRWEIRDSNRKIIIFPEVNEHSFLKTDYLLVTVRPLPINQLKEYSIISFTGLYGPGVMGVADLIDNSGDVLLELVDSTLGFPYYQSLFEVTNISHDGLFSIGTKINHIITYKLTQYLK